MKYISVLVSLSSLLTVSSKAGPTITPPTLITDYEYGFENEDYSFNVYMLGGSSVYSLHIKYYYASSDTNYASEKYTFSKNTEVDNGAKWYTTVTIPLEERITTGGIKIVLGVGRTAANPVYSKTIYVYPSGSENIDGSQYLYTSYTSNYRFFKFVDKETVLQSESFNFYGLAPILRNNKYNHLDLSSYYFTYSIDYNINSSLYNQYLVIEDTKNLFPYMPRSGNLVYVPLALTQVGTTVYVSYQQTMYVNPKTLQMSLYYETGFVKTNKFYLPLYYSKQLENYKFYFSFSRLGFSKLNMTFNKGYTNERNFFGTCPSSTYCIGGGVSE